MLLQSELDPFLYTSGPRSLGTVLIVGEAWGAEELRERKPFVGYSGKELDRILFDAGINRSDCLCTNLVDGHPEGNDFTQYLEPNSNKSAVDIRGVKPRSMLRAGYDKLEALIDRVKPKLIIGCGNWPLWALTDHAKVSTQKGFKLPSGIMSWRGSQTYTREIANVKYPYLPIIHPASIMRDWSLRNTTCQDLRARAKRFLDGKTTWAAPNYAVLADGNYAPLEEQLRAWIAEADRRSNSDPLWLAVDVETWKRRYLAVVGIADERMAICIPFFYFDNEGKMVDCFDLEKENTLNQLIRHLLSHPMVRITNQNYSYDWQYLYRYLGIETTPSFDTMLAHHLLWPGTPKSLDYLASLYCDHYCYWKDESQDWDAKSQHEDMWLYNCKDTRKTYEITFALKEILAKLPGMPERFEFQMDQWRLANEMGRRGVRWDSMRATSFLSDLSNLSRQLSTWLNDCMPEDLRFVPSTGKPWFTSTHHTQYIFYDRLGIAPIMHKKTKRPTMDKESFEQLKKKSPWIGPMLDKIKLYRSIEVYKNNFLNSTLGPDGRMHPSFNVGGTETFRWSSSSNAFEEGMNLQNIPKLDED
jgi:DNA polymerase I - 3''-5'' exonuclease and polymerase domains